MPSQQRTQRDGLARAEVIGLLVCGLLLTLLIVPAILWSRQRAREQGTSRQLQRIGVGLSTYHDSWNSYPPG